MAETGASKVCVVCKCDLAGLPRTRDKHGKYFCNSCYDKALKAKHDRQARERNAQTAGSTHHASHVDLDALLPNHGEGTGDVLDELVAPGAPPRPMPKPRNHDPRKCPACEHVLEVGAVMCTNCGYNLSSGVALQVNLPTSKPRIPKRTSTTVWAAICAVLGGAGLVVNFTVLTSGAILSRIDPNVRPSEFSIVLSLIGALGLASVGVLMFLRLPLAYRVAVTVFCITIGNGLIAMVTTLSAPGGEVDPTLGVNAKTLQIISGGIGLLVVVVFYNALLRHLRNPATRVEFGSR